MLDNTETTEVVDVPVETTEVVAEEVVAPVEETTEEVTEEPTEEVAEEKTEEVVDEVVETTEPEPITFDATDDEAVFTEKAEKVLAKFDLDEAPELKAYIETLQSKISAIETPEIFTQIADYGDVEAVTAVLDEHNTLYSRREEDGQYRPNTDKFAESLVAKDKETADFLYFDLASQPSAKYPGINKFEEGIAEALALEGESVATVLNRYHTTMKLMREGASIPTTDIPSFIPAELYGAYNTLAKDTREIMQYWDDDVDGADIANKLNELRNIQKGIDADVAEQQRTIQAQQARQQKIVSEIESTNEAFYGEMQKTMAEKLANVQFSSDPKLNKLLSSQQVTTLTQAFQPDGEFARQALKEAGINFDYGKAQQLVNDVHQASQNLIMEKNAVDRNGKPLNPVQLNKAHSTFKTVTENWLKFADDILKQEKEIAATGSAKALEAEVAKVKVQPKARPTTKGIATAATNGNGDRPPASIAYGTPAWDKWWANKTLEVESQKASTYV